MYTGLSYTGNSDVCGTHHTSFYVLITLEGNWLNVGDHSIGTDRFQPLIPEFDQH